MRSKYIASLAMNVGVAAVYLAAAKLGLSLAFLHSNVSPVWPPTGIAIAAVLWLGYRVLPGILAGAFLATWIGQAIGWYRPDQGAGFIGATIGAVLVLFIWNRLVAGRVIPDPGAGPRV